MSIKQINANDLRAMKNKEGLILQGCGGDLNEWVDGINGMLTDEEILLDGTKFENCSAFTHDGVTCITPNECLCANCKTVIPARTKYNLCENCISAIKAEG